MHNFCTAEKQDDRHCALFFFFTCAKKGNGLVLHWGWDLCSCLGLNVIIEGQPFLHKSLQHIHIEIWTNIVIYLHTLVLYTVSKLLAFDSCYKDRISGANFGPIQIFSELKFLNNKRKYPCQTFKYPNMLN